MSRVNRRSADWFELLVSLGIVLMMAGLFWSISQIGKPIPDDRSHYEIMTLGKSTKENFK